VGAETLLRQATVHDLNPFGLAMRVREPIPHRRRLRVVLLLDSGPLEVDGAVVRSEQASTDAFDVGVRFEELPQNKQDAIIRWCFAQPFGPDSPVQGGGSRLGGADPAGLGTEQVAGSDGRKATARTEAPFRAKGRSDRAPDPVPVTSDP
jgi:hypothetical protein